jgi:hypothetical protein
MANHPRGPLLTTDQAARLIMKGPERILQLAKAGWITQEGSYNRKQYRLLDVVQGYIRFRDDEDRRANKSAAHSRITDARSREVELRNAQREGRLIDLDEVLAFVEALVGMFRLLLSGLPARITRDLQFRRTIETAVNDILERIADLAIERAKALGARRAASAPIASNGAGSVGGSEPNTPANVGVPGPRDPYLTPYIVEPERLIAAGGYKRVVLVFGAQTGKTELMLDVAGQRLDQRPGPILYVGPNKQFLSEQFEPRVMALLDQAPTLMAKVAAASA